jgi:hypothetical protein
VKRATLLLLFASVLYVPYLGHLITYDEAVTVRYFAVSPLYALGFWAAPNNHLLHSFLVWLSMALVGRSELAIRLPAYFMAMLMIASTYRLGRRLHSAQAGTLTAVIITCTSGLLVFATTARGYSLGLFLAVQLIEQVLFPRKTTYTIVLLAMGLMLVLPSMVMLLAGIGIWTLWRSRRLVPPLVVGGIAGGAFYLPSLVRQTIVIEFGLPSLGDVLVSFGQLLEPLPLWGLLVLLFLVGLTQMRPDHRWLWGSIGLAVVLLTFVQWEVLHRLFYARNYLYLFPLLAVPAGIAAARLPIPARGMVALGWVLPCVVWTVGQSPISADILPVEPELVRLLDYVDTKLTPDDGLMIGCCIDQPMWLLCRCPDRSAGALWQAATYRSSHSSCYT